MYNPIIKILYQVDNRIFTSIFISIFASIIIYIVYLTICNKSKINKLKKAQHLIEEGHRRFLSKQCIENAKNNQSDKKIAFTSSREAMIQEYKQLAFNDSLTGMGNRAAFNKRMDEIPTKSLTAISLDVNYLKKTNDSLGHQAGDKLIKTLAQIVSETFEIDNCFRTGGDEFYVLLNGITESKLKTLCTKMDESIKRANKEEKDGITYSISYGYYQGDGLMGKKEIIELADQEMYAMKKALHAERKD